MKVGDLVYYYEHDYRSYYYEDGTKSSSPIERDKYRKRKIIGETKQSWIIGFENQNMNNITERDLKIGTKVKKKDCNDIIYESWEDVEKKLYVKGAYHIGCRVQELRNFNDYDKLKRIEAILNE